MQAARNREMVLVLLLLLSKLSGRLLFQMEVRIAVRCAPKGLTATVLEYRYSLMLELAYKYKYQVYSECRKEALQV